MLNVVIDLATDIKFMFRTTQKKTNTFDYNIKLRTFVSIFFCFQFQGESCTFASRRGMECMPLRTSSGAYHYHVNDQTKSLQVILTSQLFFLIHLDTDIWQYTPKKYVQHHIVWIIPTYSVYSMHENWRFLMNSPWLKKKWSWSSPSEYYETFT